MSKLEWTYEEKGEKWHKSKFGEFAGKCMKRANKLVHREFWGRGSCWRVLSNNVNFVLANIQLWFCILWQWQEEGGNRFIRPKGIFGHCGPQREREDKKDRNLEIEIQSRKFIRPIERQVWAFSASSTPTIVPQEGLGGRREGGRRRGRGASH